jgi:hypothetical protein
MKTTSTADTTAKDAPPQINQTPDGPPTATLGNLTVGQPFAMAYSRLAQSGRSPARGSDESAFMKSQLG